MVKTEDTLKESWGTSEELLLACAVNRHGTNSWDSVAMEIKSRSSSLHLLTAQNCKQKYHDLKRRFMAKDDRTDEGGDESETDDKKDAIPWLEELRKLRVAELRREVQRYDVSIVSLQLKVKRLKDEREQSLKENENGEGKADLEKDLVKERAEKKETDREPGKPLPDIVAGAPVSGDISDRENESFNESNSTDQNRGTGVEGEKKLEPVETAAGLPDPLCGESKPAGEGSHNGSSDTVAKESVAPPVGKSSGALTAREAGDSPEPWESVAESKDGGGKGTKETSDVQSSASLSGKNRREKAISGSSSGEEPETDEVSPAIQRTSVKSQPLAGFLEIIRSHKYGSVFERRLESQETAKYKSLIRQHVDLETMERRLGEGRYSGCSPKFFRDLLLLVNNAIVFFPKKSAESAAAIGLRELVSKEMASRNRKSGFPKEEPAVVSTVPPPVKPEPADSQLVSPKYTGLIACRKRSSISTKLSSAVVFRKEEQRAAPVIDEKKVIDWKKSEFSPANVAEDIIGRKRTRERSTQGARSSRTGSKGRNTPNTNKNPNACSVQNPTPSPIPGSVGKRAAPEDNSEPKTEKKSNTTAVAKKRSAANFLNRMKRNSSSNGTLVGTLNNSINNSNNGRGGGGGGGAEQKKSGGKSDGRKDQIPQQNSKGKQAAERSKPVKRSVGRPPKKATAPPPSPPPAPQKRGRETVETEVVYSRQSKKRARR